MCAIVRLIFVLNNILVWRWNQTNKRNNSNNNKKNGIDIELMRIVAQLWCCIDVNSRHSMTTMIV